MTRTTLSRPALAWMLWMATTMACSSSTETGGAEEPAQSSSGTGGATAATGTGSAGRTGDRAFFNRHAAPGETLPSDFSLAACPGVTEDASATSGLTDCSDSCGGAHCVEAEHAGGVDVILPDCKPASGGAGKCIPDKIIQSGGKFVYKSCDNDGAPGVCVPDCLILDAGAVWLTQKNCNVGELCVTCDAEVCGDRCTGNYPTFRP
jgi:hypothetical protein